jgi:probable HAF family extracellular repeat protein
MRPIRVAQAHVFISVFICSSSAAQQVPIDLGVIAPTPISQGGDQSSAFSVNRLGQIVGSSTPPNQRSAFLYTNGTMMNLDPPYPPDPTDPSKIFSPFSTAWAINDLGQIAGTATMPPPPDSLISDFHAVLFRPGLQPIDLGTFGGNQSGARGINSAGQVVGTAVLPDNVTQHAALFVIGGSPIDLDRLPSSMSAAIAINDAGTIVGWVRPAGASEHAVRWQGGQMVDLTPSLSPGLSSDAFGINISGDIVGSVQVSASSTHAALWHNAQMTDLGTLGGRTSEAWGINTSGQIVGDSLTVDSMHAFMYTGGNMVDLNTLLASNSGWELRAAYSINDNGQIVGDGFHNGQLRAFLLNSGCGQPTLTSTYPTSSSPQSIGTPNGWHMNYAISDQHGLEITDVSLDSRYMASKMNLPYFSLQTTNFPSMRCALTPNGDLTLGAACTSRLVDLQTSGGASPEIKATYEVDNVPPNHNACVLITQDYQFSPPIYPAFNPAVQGCEPSDSLPCAKFIPLVSYQFLPGDTSATVTYVNTAQRLQFAVDLPSPNLFQNWSESALFIKDLDPFGFTVVGPVTEPDPLHAFEQSETIVNAIIAGQPGVADNYHQTSEPSVSKPIPPPGCPKCMHIHWRWASGFGSAWGSGLPLVNGSDQSVQVAAVRYHPLEEDPQPDFTALVNGESLIGQPTVFWYSATGDRDHDTFFSHGAFFSPPSSGPASVSASITHSRSGNTVTVNLKLSNGGPGTAHSVLVNQLLPRLLTGTGAISYTGPSLPISIGDLIPGNFITYSLTFNVPSTVLKFSIAEGVSFQDDFGTVTGTSFSQVVFP